MLQKATAYKGWFDGDDLRRIISGVQLYMVGLVVCKYALGLSLTLNH